MNNQFVLKIPCEYFLDFHSIFNIDIILYKKYSLKFHLFNKLFGIKNLSQSKKNIQINSVTKLKNIIIIDKKNNSSMMINENSIIDSMINDLFLYRISNQSIKFKFYEEDMLVPSLKQTINNLILHFINERSV